MGLLSRVEIGKWESAASYGTGSYETGSFTPPANSLLIVVVGRQTAGGSGDPGALSTISGGSLSYNSIGSAHNANSWSRRVDAYYSEVGSSPSSMTITVDDANNLSRWTVTVYAYLNYNTSTPIAGYVTSGATDIGDGAETLTLSATPDAGDASVCVVQVDADGTCGATFGTGWVNLYEFGTAGYAAGSIAHRFGSTSTSVSITDAYAGGGTFYNASALAFIVKAATTTLNRIEMGLFESADAHGTGSYTTSAFTPPDNSLLVVIIGRQVNSGSGDPGTLSTISGGSLSWQSIGNAYNATSWSHRVDAYYAEVSTGASMDITVDDGNNIEKWSIYVLAYTNYDTSTPITGYVTSAGTDIGDGSETQTLAAAPATDDESLWALHCDAWTAPEPTLAAGWGLLRKTSKGNYTPGAVGARTGSTSTSVTITDVYTGAGTFYNAAMLSFNVKAAAGATVEDSITSDAVVKQQRDSSITSDAAIGQARSASITSDATVELARLSSITADAAIEKALSGSFAASSSIKKGVTGSLTADAAIKESASGSITVDSRVKQIISSSITSDASIKAAASSSIVSDAAIKKPASGSTTVDALIVRVTSGSITVDASIEKAQSSSWTVDAYIPIIGVPVWVSPVNTISIYEDPVLVFTMPTPSASQYMHFKLELDTADTFDTASLRVHATNRDQDNWQYYNGGDWVAISACGVDADYGGNEARYTVASPLTENIWYRRVWVGLTI